MAPQRTWIIGGDLLAPEQTLLQHALLIEKGKIAAIAPSPSISPDDHVIDAAGYFVAPGFIDVHVHGAVGRDAMDARHESLHEMARFFASHGVTSFYPTTMTDSHEAISAALQAIATCPQPDDGAQILGTHIEGPYLNVKYKGAQPAKFFRPPDPAEYRLWLETGVLRLITIAPEIEGALPMIAELSGQGVEFAVGHSAAIYEEVLQAVDAGLRQATHTYNAMLGLHHREPGTLGAVLADDRIYAQIICDGIHVHPAAVKILIHAKGPQKVILITDSIPAAGLRDGNYMLGAQPVKVEDGIAQTPGGALAGSTLTYDQGLRNIMEYSGLSLAEALPMATSIPAEAMGLSGQKGALIPGADADIVLLDAKIQVRLTMVCGKVVYSTI